jgi:hypothetical protein
MTIFGNNKVLLSSGRQYYQPKVLLDVQLNPKPGNKNMTTQTVQCIELMSLLCTHISLKPWNQKVNQLRNHKIHQLSESKLISK